MKILFILPYPTEGPSNRYRVEQYLPFLTENGIKWRLRPFISSGFYKMLYSRGHNFRKLAYFIISCAKRFADIFRANKYDIVFIHIEAFPFGPPLLEMLFRFMGKKIIFDFEDAIYLSSGKGMFKWLKNPKKFYLNLRLSSRVIVCNNYLLNSLSMYNPGITVIPTSIDTAKFKVKDHRQTNNKILIGWIGSHTTLPCLKQIVPVLQELSKKYEFDFKIIGGGCRVSFPGVSVLNQKWTLEEEVANFQGLDIGVYPLPDNEWALAKTPFKTIQYMAVGVPVVASSVGGNKEIIRDGVNGFLAASGQEWINKLSLLIEDAGLRRKIGLEGRRTVEEKYSLKINAPKFLEVMQLLQDR
ncbi:MAG: glycosyltransferase family 4 protein [Candidatus Omnitrophota bacterium]|nr:glycosyltransferase family 4 protein [Candidatus Omnitrophota bacterium]